MNIPLSERLRPKKLSEIAGQEHLIGENGFISRIIQNGKPLSLLLCGPPGCGKTTIARLYASSFGLPLINLSAVFNTTTELKKILKEGQDTPLFAQQTVLFVDEIHRFNKAQQDIFLPFLEEGTLILIGATTENPSFVINNALLSRLRVLNLEPLGNDSLEKILLRYETTVRPLNLTQEARHYLIHLSQGDGRHLLNLVENIDIKEDRTWDLEAISKLMQRKPPLYDRHQEGHYNLISALHKSIRGSDPDAAIYWFARMLEGGEDPLFLARRLVRMASEDIGLADPEALTVALNGFNTYKMLGSPEGELALAHVVIYLSLSPKSNALYKAFNMAKELSAETGHMNPPKHILNAPTSLMKEMGYSKGYAYDHDTPLGFSGQEYFPDEMERKKFYTPLERGFEREMKKRLEYFTSLRIHLQQSSH